MGLLEVDPFRRYREASARTRASLDELLSKEIAAYASEDTSLVVFGSLARGEWTAGSDLDWTYLIDGQANSDHLRISQKIQEVLEEAHYLPPGGTGIFGNMQPRHHSPDRRPERHESKYYAADFTPARISPNRRQNSSPRASPESRDQPLS